MDASALRELVLQAKEDGKTPLYVSATAGTTVLGAYDPLRAVSAVCKEFGMWMHVDASWGGAAIFSAKHKYKLDGSKLADSLTFNPHKMLHVPATCSFLLTRDTGVFHRANTLPAGYLFHSASESEEDDIWDMADLTLQCGRRADSLKLALSWTYYGSSGFETAVDNAFATTAHFASLIDAHSDFTLVSTNPPPCLQVCFYYTPGGQMGDAAENSRRTREMSARLVDKGFMVDYAPGPVGSFFRVAFNLQTLVSTVEGLVLALAAVGRDVVPV
ncbi:PLP-dependent transferase [Coniochaeta sp. PMI_546]|nr:PLP-dependent transferase [Coniochaeta sp. PMI_546]